MPLILPSTSVLFVSKASSPHLASVKAELDSVKPLVGLETMEMGDLTKLASFGENKFDVVVSLASDESNSTHGELIMVTVLKPKYETGAKHAIKLKKKPVKDAWSEESGDVGLIDENSLLTPADLAKPIVADDCEIGSTKKACKNCSCGRAEEEAQQQPKAKVTLAMLENPAVNSSCGSCSLGDAFRCGGCPYRGLPAFKPGEKIILPDDFDMDLIDA